MDKFKICEVLSKDAVFVVHLQRSRYINEDFNDPATTLGRDKLSD